MTEFVFSNRRVELRYGDDLRYNEAVRVRRATLTVHERHKLRRNSRP